MFIPSQRQWKVVWVTLGLVFLLWLLGLITPSDTEQEFFRGAIGFAVVAGALRAWMLEGSKVKPRDGGPPTA